MHHLLRMFSAENYKGTKNYIETQKIYEVIRTIIYFLLPLGLFAIGLITTGQRANLLTVVAVVGCLPACKSLVSAIMYLRYKGCQKLHAEKIEKHIGSLSSLYDMIFTSYKKNFKVSHLVVHGNMICGFTDEAEFAEKEFSAHLEDLLKMDGHKNYTIKIFTDLQKYTDRLDQLNELEAENKNISAVLDTLKSVTL